MHCPESNACGGSDAFGWPLPESGEGKELDRCYVFGLESLGALRYFEFHRFTIV